MGKVSLNLLTLNAAFRQSRRQLARNCQWQLWICRALAATPETTFALQQNGDHAELLAVTSLLHIVFWTTFLMPRLAASKSAHVTALSCACLFVGVLVTTLVTRYSGGNDRPAVATKTLNPNSSVQRDALLRSLIRIDTAISVGVGLADLRDLVSSSLVEHRLYDGASTRERQWLDVTYGLLGDVLFLLQSQADTVSRTMVETNGIANPETFGFYPFRGLFYYKSVTSHRDTSSVATLGREQYAQLLAQMAQSYIRGFAQNEEVVTKVELIEIPGEGSTMRLTTSVRGPLNVLDEPRA